MTMLIRAGLGITDADSLPQTDLAVCVQGNRIAAVGAWSELISQYPNAERAGGDHYLLLPAFVDSHDHGRGLGTASLGIDDDLLEIWIPHLWSQPVIDPYLAAVHDGLQLLRSGVGTVAHSHNPRDWHNVPYEAEETLRGYRDAGIRVAYHPVIVDQNLLVYADEDTFLAELPASVRDLAEPFRRPSMPERGDYFAMCAELMRRFHDSEQHTAHIQISPAGGQWCSDELIAAAVDFAKTHHTRVQMHMLETRYQRAYAHRRWGKSFIQHLDDLGALGDWLTLAHMIWLDEEDFALLSARGVGVAHNPSANLRLRSGIAQLARLEQAGVRVGVGLDGHTLDDDQDYFRELRLAWALGNRPGASSPLVTAETMFRIGTTSGAAITLGAQTPLGKLEPGALADLVLVDWNAVRGEWAPDGFPSPEKALAFLLHRATRHHVIAVMINGVWVVRDGRSARVDERVIAHAIRAELARQQVTQSSPMLHAARTLAPYLRRFYADWDR